MIINFGNSIFIELLDPYVYMGVMEKGKRIEKKKSREKERGRRT